MNLFDHFKITRGLYDNSFPFEKYYNSDNKSTSEDITSALDILIPKPCGHALIRIGGKGDGGYLLPDDLDGIEALFSPGVNNFKDFEDHLAHNFKIKSFMCDYTSDVNKLRTPIIHGLQFFEKKWLDTYEGDDCVSLNDWVNKNTTKDSDLILQMDIEGAEYRNLLYAHESVLKRFRIIVIELHGLRHLWKDIFLNGILGETLKKIDQHFICIHAHPNNCCGVSVYDEWIVPNVMEFTFLRKDRIKNTNIKVTLPNINDNINVLKKAPVHLEGDWLKYADLTSSRYNAKLQDNSWLEVQLADKIAKLKEREDSLITINHAIQNSIFMLRKNFANIAINKKFSQSSVSNKYKVNNSNSVISGKHTGKFGFHTNFETNPWCLIDLQKNEPVLAVVISNRLDFGAERIKTMRVLTSQNMQDWSLVYDHNGGSPFGGQTELSGVPALLLNLYGKSFQYLKIELREKNFFHLDQIEIY